MSAITYFLNLVYTVRKEKDMSGFFILKLSLLIDNMIVYTTKRLYS